MGASTLWTPFRGAILSRQKGVGRLATWLKISQNGQQYKYFSDNTINKYWLNLKKFNCPQNEGGSTVVKLTLFKAVRGDFKMKPPCQSADFHNTAQRANHKFTSIRPICFIDFHSES